MGFTSAGFWLALFFQEITQIDALNIALHLLPQVIAGILWNIVAGNIMHIVNNGAIMAVGSACYLAASLLLSLMKADSSYWAFIFPALILNVVGADFQFNVTNVRTFSLLGSPCSRSHQRSTLRST
jgi:nitrate/nitrite transporter NarK